MYLRCFTSTSCEGASSTMFHLGSKRYFQRSADFLNGKETWILSVTGTMDENFHIFMAKYFLLKQPRLICV